MRQRRWFLTATLAAGLALGLGTAAVPGPASAGLPAGGRPARATTAAHRAHTVTLLTGDRVTVSSAGAVGVTAGPGRHGVRFQVLTVRGHHLVLPADAARLVATGTLDRRLFDVTLLVNLGYDDAHRGGLPLIVGYQGPAAPHLAAATVTRPLPAIHGAAMSVAGAARASLWTSLVTAPGTAKAAPTTGIAHVWLDGRRSPALDQSVPQIGAPAAWAAGWTGTGISVAVLDTGIDATHPDLAGKVLDAVNFSAEPDATDNVGHGTHVASIIAGTGAASGGRYRGVAPGATLFNGKVCELSGCDESAILAGMTWAAADKHATVVNLSLGGGDAPDIDPLEQAVNTLTDQYGTLFVIAAGNDGPGDGTVSSPGSADAALTVGAVDKSDHLAFFSSRGPRVGDDAVKPDITAPGVDIVAARAANAVIGEPVGDAYLRLSGTSMATPHVAGSAAILAQQHPQWTAAELKAHLMASARPLPGQTGYQQGAGRVDVAQAVTQTVTTSPTSLSLGRVAWPHTDDTPITRTVTYRNEGGSAAELDLATSVTGPAGAAAPAGMFTLSANHVSVPAGGTTSVTLTADTRGAGPDGRYSGQLLATGAGTRVSTPVGISKEVESYDLTLSVLDRGGAPTPDYAVLLIPLSGNGFYFPYDPSGTVAVRLPRGGYDLSAFIFEAGAATLLSQPVLDLTRDTTVALDARAGRPFDVGVPDAGAPPVFATVGYEHTWDQGAVSTTLFAESLAGVYAAALGAPLPGTGYLATVTGTWARPGPDGTLWDSDTRYDILAYRYGQMFPGLTRHYRTGDFARIGATTAAVVPGKATVRFIGGRVPGAFSESSLGLPAHLPAHTTLFVAGDTGVLWDQLVFTGSIAPEGFVDFQTVLQDTPTGYRPGHPYRQRWNEGPFTPAFPASGQPNMGRFGDFIEVFSGVYGDAAGHAGDALTDTASTTLYRDGQLVGTVPAPGFGEFEVPPATAGYRLVVDATRGGYTDLSTSIHTEWRFRSGHTPENGTLTPLPLFTVRPDPELRNNAAPAGEHGFRVPIVIGYQPGTPVRQPRSLTVRVSYDDGRTWRDAVVRHDHDGWYALLDHPDTTGYVSLRIAATDTAGVSVDQTVIHAYRLVRD